MEGTAVDEDTLFSTIEASGARALLIGRRAMIVLGIPVMTADYDLWLHIDDVERLNAAMEAIDHHPSVPADEARRRGRYVLENDEHIDVMVARSATTKTGAVLAFDDAWARRQTVAYGAVKIAVPSIADLILTKEWGMRTKDVTDIQLLEALRAKPPVKP